jgi:hypothetical protein
MPKYTEDRCGGCNLITSPERLFKKVVAFVNKATKKSVRQRTVMWLCDDCMKADDDFKMPARSGPGHTSPALERARRIEMS